MDDAVILDLCQWDVTSDKLSFILDRMVEQYLWCIDSVMWQNGSLIRTAHLDREDVYQSLAARLIRAVELYDPDKKSGGSLKGYKYVTKEELQAGYDRHWKASHNILISMEEFLTEAEKQLSAPAADTYKALVGLVEEKKLRPGEVLGYAHFRWCLNRPEAVIAYQTGPREWTVNNCDTEITEERAKMEVCEEWEFEANRVRIIGTPYYDATDYQFIRFDCAHMAWLWQNGELYQVYH